jgi:hypothetical protein
MKRTQKYKEAIPQLLQKSNDLLDVEKIRRGCEIGNWQTALKHCLELQIEGKIYGTKTSKSWVFWKPKSKHAQTVLRQEHKRPNAEVI